MAGLVVTKTGTGGITINIPLQFETIDHLAKVIIDDLTAGAGSGPNPHQDAIQLPATLKTLANDVSGAFSALPATIDTATQTLMDTAKQQFRISPTVQEWLLIVDGAANEYKRYSQKKYAGIRCVCKRC